MDKPLLLTIISEHRTSVSSHRVAHHINLSVFGKRIRSSHHGNFFTNRGAAYKAPQTSISICGIGVDIHCQSLTRHRSVPPLSVVFCRTNGVVTITICHTIALVTEDEVIVLRLSVVAPATIHRNGGGTSCYATFGISLRNQCKAFGILGIYLQLPLLIIISRFPFFGLRSRPKAQSLCTIVLFGSHNRRSIAQEFDATTATFFVITASHDAIIHFFFSSAHRGIDHRRSLILIEISTVVAVTTIVQHRGVGAHALHKRIEILLRLRRPTGFTHGNQTRQSEELHHIGSRHVFCPECALHTDGV